MQRVFRLITPVVEAIVIPHDHWLTRSPVLLHKVQILNHGHRSQIPRHHTAAAVGQVVADDADDAADDDDGERGEAGPACGGENDGSCAGHLGEDSADAEDGSAGGGAEALDELFLVEVEG